MHDMFQTAFDDNATWGTQIFEWFSQLKVGKPQLKTVSIQVVPSQVTQTKAWR